MSLARRVVSLAIGFIFYPLSLSAQSTIEVTETISNWTAPPFWTPPALAALEKAEGASPFDAEVIEGLPTSPLPFFGIRPCRVVDTRPASGFAGAYGPPILSTGATRDFDLNSAPHCLGVPANAEAYSINVTVTETTGPGDVRIWPTGNPPTVPVSTQNWPSAGYTLANAAIVPAGTNGAVTVQVAVSNAHLIIDINGYYAPISIVNTVNGVSGAVQFSAGSNIAIQTVGGPFFISAQGLWSLTGNNIASGQFLGTTNSQPLEFRVNGLRALRIDPPSNIVGGAPQNFVTAGVVGGTVGGGGNSMSPNRVTDNFGTVAGGGNNQAGNPVGSTGDEFAATVAGGLRNVASETASTIGGGIDNSATGSASTVSGGSSNTASGTEATVPGGASNDASGRGSFAAGSHATAAHNGAFVWADSGAATITSTNANQFVVRASGGIWLGANSTVSLPAGRFLNTSTGGHLTTGGVWTNASDRFMKTNFEPTDRAEILDRVASLPISKWSFKSEGNAVRHIGPMAQDFAAAFGLGSDDKSITTIDADGVALAAIQALYEEVRMLRRRIAELESARD